MERWLLLPAGDQLQGGLVRALGAALADDGGGGKPRRDFRDFVVAAVAVAVAATAPRSRRFLARPPSGLCLFPDQSLHRQALRRSLRGLGSRASPRGPRPAQESAVGDPRS